MTEHVPAIVSALQHLADTIHDERSLGTALAGVAEAATTSVPSCDAASVVIAIEGRPVMPAMTARVALELDLAQYDPDDGPHLAASNSINALRLAITDESSGFPPSSTADHLLEGDAVLSVPALWGDEIVGTLNLFSRHGAFDETAEAIALVLATQVTIAVSRSPEFAAARSVVEQAQRDLDDQSQVQMATGMVMVNAACTADQAEGLLRSAASQDATSVVEIATRIVDQHHRSS